MDEQYQPIFFSVKSKDIASEVVSVETDFCTFFNKGDRHLLGL